MHGTRLRDDGSYRSGCCQAEALPGLPCTTIEVGRTNYNCLRYTRLRLSLNSDLLLIFEGVAVEMGDRGNLGMSTRLDDPQYWRDRAEEARVHADQMKDPQTKHMWLRIAEGHERQAQLLEKTLKALKTQVER
jgi:hypothetical protein